MTRLQTVSLLLKAAVKVLFCGANVVKHEKVSTSISANAMSDANAQRKLLTNIQSRVARQLGVSRSHVSMVANGHRCSSRVEAALKEEYKRVSEEGMAL
jgi:predicted XRE-type DNA-binding protein